MRYLSRWAGVVLLVVSVIGMGSPASAAPQPKAQTPDCGATVDKEDGKTWRCTFADEFNGKAIDEAKWQPLLTEATNLHGSEDCWVANENTIAVADGSLRLTSRREDNPFTCTKATGDTYETQISSGSVTSYGKFAQTYGRWEIRARFPEITLPGAQGTLWLTPAGGTSGASAATGEIDLAEFYSLYPDRVVPYIHYNLSSLDSTVTNTTCMVSDPWNFHTYSMVWTAGHIVIAIDGTACVDHKIHAAKPLTGSQPFDQPFVINLTQTMGLGNNAPIEGTPLPLTTEVDYVRVWK